MTEIWTCDLEAIWCFFIFYLQNISNAFNEWGNLALAYHRAAFESKVCRCTWLIICMLVRLTQILKFYNYRNWLKLLGWIQNGLAHTSSDQTNIWLTHCEFKSGRRPTPNIVFPGFPTSTNSISVLGLTLKPTIGHWDTKNRLTFILNHPPHL